MKCILLFALTAALSFAAEIGFSTGQAARLVIGQRIFTAQESGATNELVGGVSGLAFINDTLFVADSNRVGAGPINNRVLIFRNLSSALPGPSAELFYVKRCPVCTGADRDQANASLTASAVIGQPDFHKTDFGLSRTSLRLPTSVATDGQVLAIADTDNNRVLIWNSIPTTSGAPADVVIGQSVFDRNPTAIPPNNKSMRGPQGVWLQNRKLFVADTQNHRVLIYNSIPDSNGKEADLVLGQPDFDAAVQPNLAQAAVEAKPTNMLNPVAVTSDGQRLFVTDLGHNRVLVWNSIPTRNQEPADLALGQPDMTSSVANNVSKDGKPVLCQATGKDDKGNDTFPSRCEATLNFPRFALSAGGKLFIADGGNDRVLIYNHIPVRSGEPADSVIGQVSGQLTLSSDSADSLRTPMSLAWDGTNLYVSDAFNRRVMVYSQAERKIPYSGIRNAASRDIFALGLINLSGSIKENDEVTLKIQTKEYKYKILKDDTFTKVIRALVALVNAGSGDPNVFASEDPGVQGIILTARASGEEGNSVEYSVTTSTGATIVATTAGARLSGGGNAAQLAPGTVVSIVGDNLSEGSARAPADARILPTELAGTQVYFDGIRAPLFFVSPTQINTQIPFEVLDATSINAYVRSKRANGEVTVSAPVAVPIVPVNPGLFAGDGPDPRPGVVMHASSNAAGTVSVDGSIKAGDVATVTIEDRPYTYTVKAEDTLESVRDALIASINQDPAVSASAAGVFTRIRLKAKVTGEEGNGIAYSAKVNDGAQLLLTPTGSALCCANKAGALVTEDNPAIPGETIIVLATGLGLTNPLDGVKTGEQFDGPVNQPNEFVSALAGAKTANVLFAGLKPGMVGVYEVQLELNPDIPTNPLTQLTIAQNIYVSNIITFPVFNPNQEP